jgi:hypothetical protein
MSAVDFSRLVAHLRDKWGERRACAQCGSGEWSVGDRVYELTEFHEGNVIVGGPVVPVVPVTCTNCGNTVLLNALISRIVERPAPEPQQAPKGTAQ